MSEIDLIHMETPSLLNPLGARGAGEGGIFAAIPAVINAVEDALSPFKVTIDRAPATPERLWTLLNKK